MAVAQVHSGQNGNASTTSLAVALGATASSGNLLVLMALGSTSSASNINTPSGWTQVVSVASSVGSADAIKIWWKVSNGTETGETVTTTGSSFRLNATIHEFSGYSAWAVDANPTPNDSGASTSGSWQTPSTGTLATTDEVVVALVGVSTAFSLTAPSWNSSFTNVSVTTTPASVHGWRTVSANTGLAPTASWSSITGSTLGAIVAFKGSVSAVNKSFTGKQNVGGQVNKSFTGKQNVGGQVNKSFTGKQNVKGPVPTGWTVRTEADWGGDPLTRPASMTSLAAVSDGATTLNIKRGTHILTAGVETGTSQGKLDNTARKLDPSNAASPLYPNVKPRTRMRHIITVGGTDHVLHTGFAERFPIEWSKEVGYCTITTQDQLGLTATATLPPSVLDKVTRDLAIAHGGAYWPMTETVYTGTADDVAGTLDGTYIGPVANGQPVTDYDPRANPKFAKPGTVNGDDVNATAMQVTGLSVPNTFSFATWMRWDNGGYDSVNPAFAIFQAGSPVATDPSYPTPTPIQILAYLTQDAGISGRHHIAIRIQDGTNIAIVRVPVAVRILDGQPHHLAFTITGSTRSVGAWIDAAGAASGATDGSVASTVPIASINVSSVITSLNTLGVGWGIDWNNVTGTVADSAEIGHALYLPGYALTATDVNALVAAGTSPWNGDTTAQRLTRVLDLIGIDSADRNTFHGTQVCGPTILGSQNAQSYAKKILATELSELYIDGDGKWTFPARADYGTPVLVFTDDPTTDSALFPGIDCVPCSAVQPDYSYDRLVNDIVVGRENGADQEVTDATSIAAYGQIAGTKYRTGQAGASGKLDTLHQTATAARATAQWLIDRHKTPVTYIPSVTITSIDSGVTLDAMLREIGDTVVIRARPPGGGSPISLICFIEAVEHNFPSSLEWTVTFSLSDGTTYP